MSCQGRVVRGPVVKGPVVRGPVVRGPVVRGPVVRRPVVRGWIDVVIKVVVFHDRFALEIGYRHLDCAKIYLNESEIGEVLSETIGTVVKREDLFIVGKVSIDSTREVWRGKCQYSWPLCTYWLGLGCFQIEKKIIMEQCSRFLTIKYKEVSRTDTSPFRRRWLNPS